MPSSVRAPCSVLRPERGAGLSERLGQVHRWIVARAAVAGVPAGAVRSSKTPFARPLRLEGRAKTSPVVHRLPVHTMNQIAPVTGAAPTPPPAFATFKAQPLADLCGLAKAGYVRAFGAVETAKEKAVLNLKTDAKICAALQRAHAVATAQRHIPPTSFAKFHAANAGGEAPGRIMALANVFLRTVDIAEPALTEAQYDAMPSAWLERASSALNAAEKSHGADYLATTDGKAIVACLTEPGDAGKKLAALKPRKPADATAASQPVELTIERAMHFAAAELRYVQGDPQRIVDLIVLVDLLVDAMERNPAFTEDEDGPLELAIPRDRLGTFEAQLIKKGQRRSDAFDRRITSPYARAMTGGKSKASSPTSTGWRCPGASSAPPPMG